VNDDKEECSKSDRNSNILTNANKNIVEDKETSDSKNIIRK